MNRLEHWRSKSTSAHVFLCIGLGLLAQGCLPVAFVTPPLKGQLGGGASYITHSDRPDRGVDGHLNIELAVAPLSMFPDLSDRIFDFGAGYGFRRDFIRNADNHGPFLEVSIMQPIDHKVRWGLGAQYQLVSNNQGSYIAGNRVSVQAFLDWSSYSEGPFSECEIDITRGSFCGAGYSFGERGIGLYSEAGYAQIRNVTTWDLSVGLMFRIPTSIGAGVMFFDIFDLLLRP